MHLLIQFELIFRSGNLQKSINFFTPTIVFSHLLLLEKKIIGVSRKVYFCRNSLVINNCNNPSTDWNQE